MVMYRLLRTAILLCNLRYCSYGSMAGYDSTLAEVCFYKYLRLRLETGPDWIASAPLLIVSGIL